MKNKTQKTDKTFLPSNKHTKKINFGAEKTFGRHRTSSDIQHEKKKNTKLNCTKSNRRSRNSAVPTKTKATHSSPSRGLTVFTGVGLGAGVLVHFLQCTMLTVWAVAVG